LYGNNDKDPQGAAGEANQKDSEQLLHDLWILEVRPNYQPDSYGSDRQQNETAQVMKTGRAGLPPACPLS
jgi:hypothetical protein